MGNIKNNTNRGIGVKLSHREYFDFNISKDKFNTVCSSDISYTNNDHPCLITWFDFNEQGTFLDNNLKQFISLRYWDKAKYPLEPIPNFGLTGMDNGYINYSPNLMCSDDKNNIFFKTLTETKLEFPYKNNFYFTRVENEENDLIVRLVNEKNIGDVLELKGGFLQGFYKLDGYEYQTLPNRFSKGFSMSIWLKKDPVKISDDNNSNFFLFLGTRAENKYWSAYEGTDDECNNENVKQFTNIRENSYQIEYKDGVLGDLNSNIQQKRVVNNQFLIYGRSTYSHDGLGIYSANDFKCSDDVNVTVNELSVPKKLNDNPFLLYGRGRGKICSETIIREAQFTACDDLPTTDNDSNQSNNQSSLHDIIDNALGFRITENGAIQYRMVTQNNDGEIIILEESSKDNIINSDEWHNVIIRWAPYEYLNDNNNECDDESTKRLGNLMFYVDCLLKHTIKDFPEFIARRLNTEKEKQVSVPFNISLGGGTLGLKYNKTFNGPDKNDLGLVLEQQFYGSFFGRISQFKIYDCDMSWCQIKNLCEIESSRYKKI